MTQKLFSNRFSSERDAHLLLFQMNARDEQPNRVPILSSCSTLTEHFLLYQDLKAD